MISFSQLIYYVMSNIFNYKIIVSLFISFSVFFISYESYCNGGSSDLSVTKYKPNCRYIKKRIKIDSLTLLLDDQSQTLKQGDICFQLASSYLAIRKYDSVGYFAHKTLKIYNRHIDVVKKQNLIFTHFHLGMYYTMNNVPKLGNDISLIYLGVMILVYD